MRKKITGFYRLTAALTAAVMLLSFSACSGGEPAVTEGTVTDAPINAADTTADTTANTTVTETSAEAPKEIIVEMAENQVYDGTLDLIAMPDNPGCEYPANEGEVGTAGAGRISLAGEPYIFLGEDGRSLGVSNRVNRWDSIDVTLGDLGIDNYTIEVKFRSNQPLTFYIEYADTPWDALATSEEGTEATLTYDFTLDEIGVWNAADGVQNRFRLNASSNETFYVESIKIFSNGGEVVAAEEKEVKLADLTLPSLKEEFSDYFMLGNIFSSRELDSDIRYDMINHHFNVITPENLLKPANMTSKKGEYKFDDSDFFVQWAEDNDITVIGHTLVWHSQSAKWLTNADDGAALTRAEAKANMEDYIKSVAGKYAGRIYSWDVVNEAFADGKSNADWREVLRKDSPWYLAYANGAADGEQAGDYIYDAFVLARQTDPNAILYYNDYNENTDGKRSAIVSMTLELNEKWKNDSRNTEPDRKLIEGLGLQSHYFNEQDSIKSIEDTIAAFASTGCILSVTELDVPYGTYGSHSQRDGTLNEEEEKIQADYYAELFKVYLKYSNYIERVTIWGLYDSASWRKAGAPLLFDNDCAAKDAYYSILETIGTVGPIMLD